MSVQTHVVVRRGGFPDIIFATGRWSGRQAPRAVQEALEASHGDPKDFLSCLCRTEGIDGPVWVIGNRDVPVVMVEFGSPIGDYVSWDLSECSEELRAKWKCNAYGWDFANYGRGDVRTWGLYLEAFGDD